MERITVMSLKLITPALAAFVVAMVLWAAGSGLAGQPVLEQLAAEWAVLVTVAFVTALILFMVGMARLWRWTQHRTLDCLACGHLLGREREGPFGTYRRCLGCSKNIARINYA